MGRMGPSPPPRNIFLHKILKVMDGFRLGGMGFSPTAKKYIFSNKIFKIMGWPVWGEWDSTLRQETKKIFKIMGGPRPRRTGPNTTKK